MPQEDHRVNPPTMWRCVARKLAPVISSRPSPLISAFRRPPRWFQPLAVASPTPARVDRWFSSQPPKSIDDPSLLDQDEEDLGIATGLELEELLAEREGKKRFDLDPPRGPFGTKENPALIPSKFDERIVGCSGGIGDDEHDVIWFKLKKGELYECTVCTQVFKLDVKGPGGPPGGHHHH